ncbi:hypothetical protein CNECB9_770004 [Cupriavidus necator]|uniref:Uncharacterized protein n=1 Tax=Cupriavidus necator TaxID=106590 RepID=A0A1K0ISF3_CUPNE|nr:hypothetical protein CNECB9_770004 [Cupriavidus necator]
MGKSGLRPCRTLCAAGMRLCRGWFARIRILADTRAPRHPAMWRRSETAEFHPTAPHPHA